MNELDAWFASFQEGRHFAFLKHKPIAYFSIEYALQDNLPTYAGGLGVLAADYVRELYERKIPSVAIGLIYHKPYRITDDKTTTSQPSQNTNLTSVFDSQEQPLLIEIPFRDHLIFAKAWLYNKNTIPVYLLDTDIPENIASHREITKQLYDSDKEMRLLQEMVLGIGGFRLLEKLGIDPSIIHMNEGHSAMLELELIHHEMQKHHIAFHEAASASCHHVVFTNHTLVPAGNETFGNDMFSLLLDTYASTLAVPVSDILSLGAVEESKSFSMTLLALRVAGKSNAVSALHAKKTLELWPSNQFESVTNGIHLRSWDGINNGSLAMTHKDNKRTLLRYIEELTKTNWDENHFLLGWARRLVPYKRPYALFEDIEKIKKMVNDQEMPVRIVISGEAPPKSQESYDILQKITTVIDRELKGRAIYLPNYSTSLARLLTGGCDMWLNTPVVGSEACGTSGMKACLNGVLPLTTKDGWIDEVDLTDIGWILDTNNLNQSIIETLQNMILPMYYHHESEWEERMQKARSLILKQFSTTRMLKDYFEKLYLPIIETSYNHYFS